MSTQQEELKQLINNNKKISIELFRNYVNEITLRIQNETGNTKRESIIEFLSNLTILMPYTFSLMSKNRGLHLGLMRLGRKKVSQYEMKKTILEERYNILTTKFNIIKEKIEEITLLNRGVRNRNNRRTGTGEAGGAGAGGNQIENVGLPPLMPTSIVQREEAVQCNPNYKTNDPKSCCTISGGKKKSVTKK